MTTSTAASAMATLFAKAAAALLAVAGTLLIASCGGGSSDAGGGAQIGGINGGGHVARGAITGFGSIFVNGIEFRTNGATITVDGQSSAESALKVGQVVVVHGSVDSNGRTGAATTVDFDADVEGPILSIDVAGNTLVVLGQTVHIDGTTTFDDSSIEPPELASLHVGDVVEVSGFRNDQGEIVATRIENAGPGGDFEVFGTVANLDANVHRFNLAALVVDYSTAQLVDGSPANGACVEVKGATVNAGVLTATRVEVKDCQPEVENGDEGELEGLITALRSTSDFDVGGQRVTTSAGTVFEGGTSADLVLNAKVEVEGSFDANGTLVASKVEIKPASSLRLLGVIDALDPATSTLTVFGIHVATNLATRFEDKGDLDVSPFNFAALHVGDYVEVRGFAGAAADSITATILERNDLDTRRELRGPATDVLAPDFKILGVMVTTNAGTEFQDGEDNAIDAATFFAGAAGKVIKVRGDWNGTVFTADEAEFEDD